MAKKVLLLVSISDEAFDLMKGGRNHVVDAMIHLFLTDREMDMRLTGIPLFELDATRYPESKDAMSLMLSAEFQRVKRVDRRQLNLGYSEHQPFDDPDFFTTNPE